MAPPLTARCSRPLLAGPLRAVILSAVLFGLFLMHGASAGTGGCPGGAGAAMTAMTMPGTSMTAGAPARTGSAAGHLMAGPGLTRAITAPVPRSAAGGNSTAAGGMLCSSLPRRDAPAGAAVMALAGVAVVMAREARPGRGAGLRRVDRPPGRPGLPLPLFLGVSRT